MTGRTIASILLIEDNRGDARLLREMLNEAGSHAAGLTHVQTMAAAEEFLAAQAVEIILLDLGLPDAEGLDAVRRVHAAAPRVPLVVLTGRDDEALAGHALQEGAQDYLIKGQIETRGLLRALRYAIERSQMEEVLFVEQMRAQVTLDCIAEAVACTDTSGNITFMNAVAETMTGWRLSDAMGRAMAEVFPTVAAFNPDDTASVRRKRAHAPHASARADASDDLLLRALRRGDPVELAYNVFRRADGTTFAAEYSSAPMHDSNGLPVGSVVAIRDISERRAIERLQDEFVSTVSHELRTPLTSIRGSLGLLGSGMLGDLGEKGKRMLEIAVANTDRLVRLINDILDIERLDSGHIELRRAVVSSSALMEQAVDLMQTMADAAGVGLTLHPLDALVCVDSDRIIQTLTNLIGNAVKFSPAGTVVILSATRDDGMVTMSVADQGRGIPEGKEQLIFERFKQVDASDSRDKGGSGLGLAISSSIIAAHGGRIWTEKNGDTGSVFLFTLAEVSADFVCVQGDVHITAGRPDHAPPIDHAPARPTQRPQPRDREQQFS